MPKKATTKTEATKPTTAVNGKKYCPKCGRTLDVKMFPKDARRKDGLYIYDRECEAKRQYEKYTKKMVAKAETEGIIVLRINHKKLPDVVDVLKVEEDQTHGKLIITELQTSE